MLTKEHLELLHIVRSQPAQQCFISHRWRRRQVHTLRSSRKHQNRPTPPIQLLEYQTDLGFIPVVTKIGQQQHYNALHYTLHSYLKSLIMFLTFGIIKQKSVLQMYPDRMPQQCACFVRVNPIGTKHFILDHSYLKVFLITLIWLHSDSPIPRSLHRMRFGERKALLEFHIFQVHVAF